jgi:hypothetical protein
MEIVKSSLYTLHFLFVRRRRPIILHSLHFLRYEDKTTGWASGLGRSDSVQTRMQYMPPAHSFFGPHLALWSSGERYDVGCIYSYQLRPNIDNDDLCTCLPLSSIVRAAQNTGHNMSSALRHIETCTVALIPLHAIHLDQHTTAITIGSTSHTTSYHGQQGLDSTSTYKIWIVP